MSCRPTIASSATAAAEATALVITRVVMAQVFPPVANRRARVLAVAVSVGVVGRDPREPVVELDLGLIRRVLDCGTGSGALLLAVLAQLPVAEGIGIDRSGAALAIGVVQGAVACHSGMATFAEAGVAAGA